jgi:hypothetical protein
MKDATKTRIQLAIILLIPILTIGFIIYMVWGPKVTLGEITHGYLVDINDKERIDVLMKDKRGYTVKVQEGNNFYLLTHGLDYKVAVGKYILSKKQYDNLQIGTFYWFKIKYYKPYDGTTGVVKGFYTDNPVRY